MSDVCVRTIQMLRAHRWSRVESDNYFDSLNQLHQRFKDLDDRGLVLTLAAFAEDSLAELLTAFMQDNSATRKLIGGFDAPLGTLSSRISACYALGILTKGQYHDLEHLRFVRNKFSHTWAPISFDDTDVRKHIEAMHYSNLIEIVPGSLREKIESSISILLLEIRVAIRQLPKTGIRTISQGSRIYSGLNWSTEEQIAKCRARLTEINLEIKGAKAAQKEFLTHLKRMWLEKYYRVALNAPKSQFEEITKGMLDFASPEEVTFSGIYDRNL